MNKQKDYEITLYRLGVIFYDLLALRQSYAKKEISLEEYDKGIKKLLQQADEHFLPLYQKYGQRVKKV